MVSLVRLLVELVTSFVELLVFSVTRVALLDPLAFASFVMGGALIAASMGVLGYLAVGAFFGAVSDALGNPGRPPQRAR